MLNTVKKIRGIIILITILEYVFILCRVENDLSEEQFVARVHKNLMSEMSTYELISVYLSILLLT